MLMPPVKIGIRLRSPQKDTHNHHNLQDSNEEKNKKGKERQNDLLLL